MQLPLFIGPVAWDLAERCAAATLHGPDAALALQVQRGGEPTQRGVKGLAVVKQVSK